MSRVTKFEFPAQIGIDQSERSLSNRQKGREIAYTTTCRLHSCTVLKAAVGYSVNFNVLGQEVRIWKVCS